MSQGGESCWCGAPVAAQRCCAPVVRGERPAPTAERLMRSRFSAFVLGDEAHLLRSWHASTRPEEVRFVPGQRWSRLEVLDTRGGGALDDSGEVEFRAHHVRDGRPGSLHERSRFVRDDDRRWVYLGPVEPRT
jgi:SEC-C motif-containing protein